MTIQQGEQFISDLYGDDCCSVSDTEYCTLADYEESIAECDAMLSYSIDLNDKSEIAFWRKMLQRAKVERREFLGT